MVDLMELDKMRFVAYLACLRVPKKLRKKSKMAGGMKKTANGELNPKKEITKA